MKSKNENIDIQLANEKLAQAFYSNGRYNAVFLGVTGIGFVVIYLLTRFNIFGETTPQLLYISGAIFLLAISQIPLLNLARRKLGIATNILAAIFVSILRTTVEEVGKSLSDAEVSIQIIDNTDQASK
jgi:hypothetical protein